MATIREAIINQSGYEIRQWTADFTDDLPSGGSVTGGTAYHFPPGGGSTVTPTISVSTPNVSAQLSNLADFGQHQIAIVGTFSNSEKSEVRVFFYNGYESQQGRAGMATLLRKLRGLTSTGPADYKVGGIPYWSDAHLQEIMDDWRIDFQDAPLSAIAQTTAASVNDSGTVQYKKYVMPYQNVESIASGTAIFDLRYSNGGTVTQAFTVDYARGVLTFTNDQGGTAFYLSGRSYDLNAAAAQVWRHKAAHYAEAYDIETGDKVLNRSQLIKQSLEMANQYEVSGGVDVLSTERLDTL